MEFKINNGATLFSFFRIKGFQTINMQTDSNWKHGLLTFVMVILAVACLYTTYLAHHTQ